MDKDDLNDLIDRICRLDIERDGDEAEQLAKDMEDKVADQVRRAYDQTVDDGSHVWDELGRLEGDAKSLRDRAHDLAVGTLEFGHAHRRRDNPRGNGVHSSAPATPDH